MCGEKHPVHQYFLDVCTVHTHEIETVSEHTMNVLRDSLGVFANYRAIMRQTFVMHTTTRFGSDLSEDESL